MQKSSTIGSLIDIAVRAAYEAQESSGIKQFTKFIANLTEGSTLSPSQISRMRDCTGYPQDTSMERLIELVPELDLLDSATITNRLLLPWSAIQRDQDKLPNNTVITIVSGWQAPKATYSRNIAESIAININKGFSYLFVYPNPITYSGGKEAGENIMTEWMDSVKKKVALSWKNHIEWSQPTEPKSVNVKESIDEEVNNYIGAINTTEQSNFWFELPAPYCVFYNLGVKGDSASRHGIFNVQGSLMNADDENNIFSEGWLLSTKEQFQSIETSFLRDTIEADRNKFIRKTS